MINSNMFESTISGMLRDLATTRNKYPFFNILKGPEDNRVIELAVAGMTEKDLDVEWDQSTDSIKVTGNCERSDEGVLYRGISGRSFVREFYIGPDLEPAKISLNYGILSIELKMKPEVEAKKVKKLSFG